MIPLLNPLQQILTAAGICAVSLLVGFVGGCEHRKDAEAAERLEATRNAARLAKQDGMAGANAVAALRQKEQDYAKAGLSLSKEARQKPLFIVSAEPRNCPLEIAVPKDSSSKEGTMNETPTENVLLLTPDFKRLYDASYHPKGNLGVRAGTYEAAKPTSFNEGFADYIIPNNVDCAIDRERLAALQTRIVQKQKLYSKLFKD